MFEFQAANGRVLCWLFKAIVWQFRELNASASWKEDFLLAFYFL
jgi:hypothetical protein